MSRKTLAIMACLAILPSAGSEILAQREGGPPRGRGGEAGRPGEQGQSGARGGRGERGGGGGRAGGQREGGGRGGFGGGGGQRGGPGGGRGGFETMLRMMPLLKALDTDGDGKLSKVEIANATVALKKLDKNGDGKLEGAEIQPDMSALRGGGRGEAGDSPRGGSGGGLDTSIVVNRMMKMDKNDDQKLTKEEVGERLSSMFTSAEENKDGFVTKAELEKLMASRQRRSGRGGHGSRGRAGRGGGGAPARSGRPDADDEPAKSKADGGEN